MGEIISCDFQGPFPTSIGGSKYIFSIVDIFSKYVTLFVIKKENTETVLNKLTNEYFKKFKKPEKILVDNGTQFTSTKFINKLNNLGVKVIFVSIRNPKANPIERVHRSINQFFRILIKKKHTEWAKWVPIITNILNETCHSTTEFTPMEIQLNKKPTRFWEKYIDIKSLDKYSYERKIFLTEKRIKTKTEKQNSKINKKHINIEYNIGDMVMVKTLNVSDATNKIFSKFLDVFEGPYVISDKFNATYSLTNPTNNKFRGKFHCSLIKKYNEQVEEFKKSPNKKNGKS